MTDMEIPQAALEAAAAQQWVEVWSDLLPWEGVSEAEKDECRRSATAVLEAALPHLLTEVKSMCETATAVALKLGRQEAAMEAATAIRSGMHAKCASGHYAICEVCHAPKEAAHLAEAVGSDDLCDCIIGPNHTRADHASLLSRFPGATSNGLTASSRHPGTPEDTKPPQEAL